MTDQAKRLIRSCDEENPEDVSGDAVDEAEVLGEYAPLADPAAHQGGDA